MATTEVLKGKTSEELHTLLDNWVQRYLEIPDNDRPSDPRHALRQGIRNAAAELKSRGDIETDKLTAVDAIVRVSLRGCSDE